MIKRPVFLRKQNAVIDLTQILAPATFGQTAAAAKEDQRRRGQFQQP